MIETVAAYVAVIEFLIKVVGYGNRVVRDALAAGTTAIEKDKSIQSVEDARRVLEKSLVAQLGKPESITVIEDIQVIERVLPYNLDQYLPPSVDEYTLIPQSILLEDTIDAIGAILHDWQCFELFGLETRYDRHILPFDNTMKGIAGAEILRGVLKSSLLFRRNAFLERRHTDGYRIINLVIRESKPFSSPDEIYICFTGKNQYMLVGDLTNKSDLPLTFEKFQPILLGLLLDLIAYSQRIRQQAVSGQTLVQKLFKRSSHL